MLNRMSVTALLTSVIALMACGLVVLLSVGAWTSWKQLRSANRIHLASDIAANAFKAMHNLRVERSAMVRELNSETTVAADTAGYLQRIQNIEMTSGANAIALSSQFDFAGRETLLSELNRNFEKVKTLQATSWEALHKPKASRQADLVKDYRDSDEALLKSLEQLSERIGAEIARADPIVDHLFNVKQAAWLLRNTAGEASLIVSLGLAGQPLPPDAMQTYLKLVGGIQAEGAALASLGSAADLPPAIGTALAQAKASYFDPQYTSLRDRLIKALVAGDKPEMPGTEWSPFSADKMASAVVLAETALDNARDHAAAGQSSAARQLAGELALLFGAIALAGLSMAAIRGHVIRPLHAIRDAMLKVAGGDLAAEVPCAGRRDEIGSLAGALVTFRQNAVEKRRMEVEETNRTAAAAARQQAVERHIARFEERMRETLSALGEASRQMGETSSGMSDVSERTTSQVQQAVRASGNASANVQSVASASEELSSSINDISRQVTHAADIAARAVAQARATDSTVQGLAQSAARIGEVVDLINSIATQTNLLALNATIEAARAGESGKGFSVVASEVKSLANQTAKATEEISQQIVAVQNVAGEAMEAIRAIGGTIAEVSEVATAIAAAVEEQGAATEEISRNTQAAAQGTRAAAENITGVSAGAEATGSAAHNVRTAAETLEQHAIQLRAEVSEFLGNIRAA